VDKGTKQAIALAIAAAVLLAAPEVLEALVAIAAVLV